jgi:hypothetical protein
MTKRTWWKAVGVWVALLLLAFALPACDELNHHWSDWGDVHHGHPEPPGTTAPFITASLRADPPSYTGPGPVPFFLRGQITANQRCAVTYRIVFSNGDRTGIHALNFPGPGTQDIPPMNARYTASASGWAKIRVESPVVVESPQAPYAITITAGPPPGPCQVVSVRWDEDPPADLVPRTRWAGRVRCIIRFTQPVDPTTVNMDRDVGHCGIWITLFDNARPGGTGTNWSPAGTVFFSRDQKTFVYVSNNVWPPEWAGVDRLRYTIGVLGYDASTRPSGVKDARGQALDGNRDGRPGGDYSYEWTGPAQR